MRFEVQRANYFYWVKETVTVECYGYILNDYNINISVIFR